MRFSLQQAAPGRTLSVPRCALPQHGNVLVHTRVAAQEMPTFLTTHRWPFGEEAVGGIRGDLHSAVGGNY